MSETVDTSLIFIVIIVALVLETSRERIVTVLILGRGAADSAARVLWPERDNLFLPQFAFSDVDIVVAPRIFVV